MAVSRSAAFAVSGIAMLAGAIVAGAGIFFSLVAEGNANDRFLCPAPIGWMLVGLAFLVGGFRCIAAGAKGDDSQRVGGGVLLLVPLIVGCLFVAGKFMTHSITGGLHRPFNEYDAADLCWWMAGIVVGTAPLVVAEVLRREKA